MPIDLKPILRRALRTYYVERERVRHQLEVRPYRGLPLWSGGPRRSGVLLVGYIEVGFGLGQVIRGLARGLESVGEPFAILPYRVNARRGVSDRSFVRHYDVDGHYPINVLCMARDQTGLAFHVLGRRRMRRAYNILSTFWELASVPPDWRPDLARFDEIWAPNDFVGNALRPHFDGPITIIPTTVDADLQPEPDHAAFGLERDRRWFLFTFDYNAFAERKNPLASIQAFRAAFPKGCEPVGLIVKSNGLPDRQAHIRDAIATAALADPRIRIIHAELPRALVTALFNTAHAYVSLHRAEGFGYGMAEAMLLGKPVIATGYSGNVEFTNEATAFVVPSTLVPVPPGAYPDAAGAVWAEPDIAAAAMFMRQSIDDPATAALKAHAGRAFVAAHYSSGATGRAASARLAEIRALLAARATGA